MSDNIQKELTELTGALRDISSSLQKQTNFKRKFLMGLFFGVGTAIGASVIATLIIISLANILQGLGIEFLGSLQDATETLREQINMQTPGSN